MWGIWTPIDRFELSLNLKWEKKWAIEARHWRRLDRLPFVGEILIFCFFRSKLLRVIPSCLHSCANQKTDCEKQVLFDHHCWSSKSTSLPLNFTRLWHVWCEFLMFIGDMLMTVKLQFLLVKFSCTWHKFYSFTLKRSFLSAKLRFFSAKLELSRVKLSFFFVKFPFPFFHRFSQMKLQVLQVKLWKLPPVFPWTPPFFGSPAAPWANRALQQRPLGAALAAQLLLS